MLSATFFCKQFVTRIVAMIAAMLFLSFLSTQIFAMRVLPTDQSFESSLLGLVVDDASPDEALFNTTSADASASKFKCCEIVRGEIGNLLSLNARRVRCKQHPGNSMGYYEKRCYAPKTYGPFQSNTGGNYQAYKIKQVNQTTVGGGVEDLNVKIYEFRDVALFHCPDVGWCRNMFTYVPTLFFNIASKEKCRQDPKFGCRTFAEFCSYRRAETKENKRSSAHLTDDECLALWNGLPECVSTPESATLYQYQRDPQPLLNRYSAIAELEAKAQDYLVKVMDRESTKKE